MGSFEKAAIERGRRKAFAECAQIYLLYNEGAGVEEIASRLKLEPDVISRLLAKHNLL